MRKFLEFGNRYAKESDWTDFALTKLCLCAMGLLIGISIPARSKKPAAAIAGGLFASTYIVLMMRVFGVFRESCQKE